MQRTATGHPSQQTLSEQFVCSVQYNEVYVWGDNQHGQLGIGNLAARAEDNESRQSISPMTMMPKICCFNTVINKVSCGMSHTIMLSASGHIYAMGSNQYGQLGIGEPYKETDEYGNAVVF
jgi:alpha-tubulin suppressor-like RCC1 family protein